MNLKEYQIFVEESRSYYHYPDKNTDFLERICGLSSETGEVLQLIQKLQRGKPFTKEELASELGDVLYYVSAIASMYHLSMEGIAWYNKEKLEKRHERN